MQKNNEQPQQGKHEHPLPQEISQEERSQASQAHNAAEKDMKEDKEFSSHSPKDDLDEAESARLGNKTPLI